MTRNEWRNLVSEEAIDPDLPIIDAHHHIWPKPPAAHFEVFGTDELIDEVSTSHHNIVSTVYVEGLANYRDQGPANLRPVGETEFAEEVARKCMQIGGKAAAICAGIVAHADLTLGARVEEVLAAHKTASPTRFRGIRQMTVFDSDFSLPLAAPGMLGKPEFQEGGARMAVMGLSLDVWVFHTQLPELVAFARKLPELTIVLNHVGCPLGIGRFADARAEVFAHWKSSLREAAACNNITVKLGGLNTPSTGLGYVNAPKPPTSAELANAHRDYLLTAIDFFGPQRCMFESNFPVDRMSTSYDVLWNAFKLITRDFSVKDRSAMFHDVAKRIYRLN